MFNNKRVGEKEICRYLPTNYVAIFCIKMYMVFEKKIMFSWIEDIFSKRRHADMRSLSSLLLTHENCQVNLSINTVQQLVILEDRVNFLKSSSKVTKVYMLQKYL